MTGLSQIGRALRHRNYRLFFIGQGTSLVGTWMTRIATSWLVYRLTDSTFLLGLVGFAGQIPIFVFSPLAGALVDRWNRRRLLLATQVLSMVQSLLLAVLALTGRITVGQVLALSVVQGLINVLDMPARQAFVVEIIERREDLPNAIALNSTMFTAARLVGPAAAGILIGASGEGICFLVDGLSFLAVIASLLLIRLPAAPPARPPEPLLGRLVEGFRYAFGFTPIRAILLFLATTSLMGMQYTVLLPAIARDVLKAGSTGLGFLSAASGLGALAGALYLASRISVLGLGRVIAGAGACFGAGLVVLSFSRSLVLSMAILLVTGMGMMVQMAASNTIIQTIVDDEKRGRVMGFYTMTFIGMTPFGSLLAGVLSGWIGSQGAIRVGGIACLAAAVLFALALPGLRERVRPIYVRKGILPEVASGIQSAVNLSEPHRD